MIKQIVCLSLFLLSIQTSVFAAVRLPQLVRDSMVLQRDAKIRIWGWADANEKIIIRFKNRIYNTTASAEGNWMVYLAPAKAGGPFTMSIDAGNHISLKDILVGDVWICAGQSNMVHQMILHRERYAADIAKADFPQIRLFLVPAATNLQGPQNDLATGFWKSANPDNVLQFSVVAYFFARKLYTDYKVPIGLINASVGGPPIQAWISEDGLKRFPSSISELIKNKNKDYVDSITKAALASQSAPINQDKGSGLHGEKRWYDLDYVPKNWRSINVPGYWEDQGANDLDGIVWYRKWINIPASLAGLPAKIILGRMVDADMVYLNGKKVGETTYQYPQRRYQLPAGSLKPGRNLLVVRITNYSGKGGFVPDKPYYLTAGTDSIGLAGKWEYKVGQAFEPLVSTTLAFSAQDKPAALYNAMIAPLIHFSVRGILYYQGESNTGNPKEFELLMPALIHDWRAKWEEGNIPFLFVQLPNFMDVKYLPSESQWAETREAQRKTLRLPNTGMAVSIDLGEWNDIHPDRKKEIGERLALLAARFSHGDSAIVATGPMFQSSRIEGNKIILHFTDTGSGLKSKDGETLSEFAIAGADKHFVWAHAEISGDEIIVWSDSVAHPVHVRYAWADNPDDPNLYNKEDLPASPFEN